MRSHFCIFFKRNKGIFIFRSCNVFIRSFYYVCIVNTDCHFFSIPTDNPVKVFLEIHNVFEFIASKINIVYFCKSDIWSDFCYITVYSNIFSRFNNFIIWKTNFLTNEAFKRSGNSFYRQVVWSVREEFNFDFLIVKVFNIARHHR